MQDGQARHRTTDKDDSLWEVVFVPRNGKRRVPVFQNSYLKFAITPENDIHEDPYSSAPIPSQTYGVRNAPRGAAVAACSALDGQAPRPPEREEQPVSSAGCGTSSVKVVTGGSRHRGRTMNSRSETALRPRRTNILGRTDSSQM
jgi:hypothetical protein